MGLKKAYTVVDGVEKINSSVKGTDRKGKKYLSAAFTTIEGEKATTIYPSESMKKH